MWAIQPGASNVRRDVPSSVPPSLLLTNLVSHWTLNEASGTRFDSVLASGNNLTDNNAVTQAAGKVGNAAQFTAVNSESLSRASNASLQIGDIDFTIAAWVYLDTLIDMALISKDMSGGGKREFDLEFLHGATDKFRMRLFRAVDSSIAINDTTVISPATWYYVIGWHDAAADTMNIQVNNGSVVSAATGGALQAASDGDWYLGARQFTGAQAFTNGRLNQVSFWKRVLTANQRTALYNGGNGVTYPFLGL
jgi:hypothetical protein